MMHIDSYSFGNIVIDGEKYNSDIIIYGGKIESWWRDEGHLLKPVDLERIWPSEPEKLIVGCGASGVMKVDPKVRLECDKRGVELVAVKTNEAVELFNREKKQQNLAAGLHLTC